LERNLRECALGTLEGKDLRALLRAVGIPDAGVHSQDYIQVLNENDENKLKKWGR
jgi:hypothetical protein